MENEFRKQGTMLINDIIDSNEILDGKSIMKKIQGMKLETTPGDGRTHTTIQQQLLKTVKGNFLTILNKS